MYIYNLQEPTNFFVIMGISFIACMLYLGSLCIKEIKSRVNLRKRILADIKEEKAKNPNCVCSYRGKIY